jgi:hypothetical protein
MFDYVMALASVIVGLALAHLMQGFVGLFEEPKKIRIWWVHLVWVGTMITVTVCWWWGEYLLHDVRVWTLPVYFFVLAYAFLTYMSAAVLFPKNVGAFASYEDVFLSRRRLFFGLQIIAILIDPIDTFVRGRTHLSALGPAYWTLLSIDLVLAFVAAFTTRKVLQGPIALWFLLSLIGWVWWNYATLG